MPKKLLPNHPLSKKVLEIESLMQKLQITLSWNGYFLEIQDDESKLTVIYKDADSGENLQQFPYCYETKLVIED